MPQPTKGPRLGGSPAHQKLMLANLATSLFTHGRIHTTRTKAERLRPYAERLITKAKKGDLHNRREIAQVIRDKDVVHRLIAEIGPFFADRPGGYTRITKTLPRKGDNAPMAIIELVNERTASAEASQATRVASSRPGQQPGSPATGAAATSATIASAESGEETSSPEVPEAEAAGSSTDEPSVAQPTGTDDADDTDVADDADSSATTGGDDAPRDTAGGSSATAGPDTSEDADSSATTKDES